MTRTIYYTATTLDGFIADEHDSLDWLLHPGHRRKGSDELRRLHAGHRCAGHGVDDL